MVSFSDVIEKLKAFWPGGILYVVIPLLLAGLVIFSFRLHTYIRQWFSRLSVAFKALFSVLGIGKTKDVASLNEAIVGAGYAYDPQQDIFYSILEPWQKGFGYCRLYDEAAAPMGMIVDCDPVYFEYDGKKWLIEFWKGQYDLTTGCEIGIYTTTGPDLNIPGVFNGTFYDCPSEADFLDMSCCLKKNGKTLFIRKGRHWWLTGFKLGEFSEPSALTMYINIALKDRTMRDAFVEGLRKAGYPYNAFAAYGNTISLIFGKPYTQQPRTRIKATDEVIQKKNKLMCDRYQDITQGCTTLQDKLNAVQEKAPELVGYITGLGRPKQAFSAYDTIKKYLK